MDAHCLESLKSLFFGELADEKIACNEVKTLSVTYFRKLECESPKNPLKNEFIIIGFEEGMIGEGAIDIFFDLREDRMFCMR